MNWFLIISCLAFGVFGAWFMSRYAYRFGLLDIPNDRSSHSLPTPRGGGIGIFAAFIVSSLWLRLSLFIWLPAALLALVSFFDDRLDLSPRTRLIFQFCAALIVAGFAFNSYDVFSIQHPVTIIQNLITLLFSIIVIVGTANFYNFMDGINGIAGITGVVAFALTGLFAYTSGHTSVAISSWCISAACIGFLPFNMPKAKVFMGDVGSILLGFVFASYVMFIARTVAEFLLLTGFLSTFYADTLSTLWFRNRDGERLSQAHRRHLYQLYANQKQIPHLTVSISYGLVQILFGLLLFYAYRYGLIAIVILEVCLCLVWFWVMLKVRREVENNST